VSVLFTRGLAGLPTSVDTFLAARPERNVAASLLTQARAGTLSDAELQFAYEVATGGEVRSFAMRTPPWPLLITELDSVQAQELVDLWLPGDPGLPGVSGVPESAWAVARAWERRTGGRASSRMRDAMHELHEVTEPPRPAAGHLRRAGEEDRRLLIAWERSFVADAGVISAAAAEAERTVARRLSSGLQYIWQDGGAAVSTLAVSPLVAGTVRIGPVYTPPEHRCRGYASAAVAAVSRNALADGAERCMLFTDLANPTSNKIYAAVGYRRFAAWEELEFLAP
jgi:RimJ/RimL family protein N-acetyltransferase